MTQFVTNPQSQVTVTVPTPLPVPTRQQKPTPTSQPVANSQVYQPKQPPVQEPAPHHFATVIPHSGAGIVNLKEHIDRGNAPTRYSRKVPVGKHGTDSWNPGNPDEATIERRKMDPLWAYHRGQVGYAGPIEARQGRPPVPWIAVLASQGNRPPSRNGGRSSIGGIAIHKPPEGFNSAPEWDAGNREGWHGPDVMLGRGQQWANDEYSLTHPNRLPEVYHNEGNDYHRAYIPLTSMIEHAEYGDPYRLWAASILGGNRHAIPHLVYLLRQRDNPVGWWKGWSDLHRRMEHEQGDLPPDVVAERLHRIAQATSIPDDPYVSMDREGHDAIAETAHIHAVGLPDLNSWAGQQRHVAGNSNKRDFTGYKILADHMGENGLHHYANLICSELQNIPEIRAESPKPKGRRRFQRSK